MEVKNKSFFAPSSMERATKLIICLIILLLLNSGNVFANSYKNVEIVDTGLEQLGYLDYYLNKEFNSNLTTTIYDNKNYYDNYCDYKDLREILNQYDWIVFQANENFGMSIGGNTSAIAVIYAGYGNNPYNTDYTKIQNTRIQKFYFTNASFNKALILADKASAQNTNTTIVQRAYFEIWTYKGEILYTKTYEPPQLKQPYFEFTAKKIGTTTLENVDGNINTYYKSSFDGFVNSYTSNDEIGYLYIPANYGFGDVFYPKLFIFKNNLSQTQQWLYTGYDFFLQEQTTEYNKFIITVDQSIITAPYYYDILLQSVNEDFEDTHIRFVVINENISGPIIETPSGDIISGDATKDETTIGDIQNDINEPYNPNKNILNEMKSGDVLNNIGYSPVEDENADLWDIIINGYKEVLLKSGDVILEVPLRTKTIEINSNQIIQKDSPLKFFTASFTNFWLLMQMYTYIKKTIDQINEGDLKVMHEVDADCYFF